MPETIIVAVMVGVVVLIALIIAIRRKTVRPAPQNVFTAAPPLFSLCFSPFSIWT